MILHMIHLDPEARYSAEMYLQNYAGVVLPSYFSPFLHNFYSLLNPLNADARVMLIYCFGLLMMYSESNYHTQLLNMYCRF